MVYSTCPLADSNSPDSAHSSVHLCFLYSPNSVLHVLSFHTTPCQRSTGSKSCYSYRLQTKKHTYQVTLHCSNQCINQTHNGKACPHVSVCFSKGRRERVLASVGGKKKNYRAPPQQWRTGKETQQRRMQDGRWPQMPSTRQITVHLHLMLSRKTETCAT